jgi:hypothetical protein
LRAVQTPTCEDVPAQDVGLAAEKEIFQLRIDSIVVRMSDSDNTRKSMEDVREELVALKTLMTRAEDRSLGYFIAATGLSFVAISIGLASMPDANPNEDLIINLFRFGVALTIAGLLAAFTMFLSIDPKAETLLWLDKHQPYVHLRRRKNRGSTAAVAAIAAEDAPAPQSSDVKNHAEPAVKGQDARVQPNKEQEDTMLVEYQALERRLQNDANVGYAFAGAMSVASLAVFSLLASRFAVDTISWKGVIITIIAAAVSIAGLVISYRVLLRFRDAGDIRMARAVWIEEQRHMYSFRLFPPWSEKPPDFRLKLGELKDRRVCDDKDNDEKRRALETAGDIAYSAFAKSSRVTKLFRDFIYTMCMIWTLFIMALGLIGFHLGTL